MKSKFNRSKLSAFFALFSSRFFRFPPAPTMLTNSSAPRCASGIFRARRLPSSKTAKVVKTAGYGLASVEFNVPATPETVFEIGSVSKQITAAAIMLLVEDGKINLDEKISRYLPNTPDAWKNVTTRHLLTHTSGIKSYSSLDGFELNRRLKRDDFIKLLSVQPLDFETGASYVQQQRLQSARLYYRNGFRQILLGFLRERIFTPLGMTKTADRDPKYIIKNRATGYEWENGN
jgi:CubicO group peptidase (beta-lactamase class C family)